jgi:hypothetical protein
MVAYFVNSIFKYIFHYKYQYIFIARCIAEYTGTVTHIILHIPNIQGASVNRAIFKTS